MLAAGLRGTLAVVGGTAEQVVLANGPGPIPIDVQGLKGRELELLTAVFLPRNSQVELRLKGVGAEALPALLGTVRRVQMQPSSSAYATWVRLERVDPALLSVIQGTLADLAESSQGRSKTPESAGPQRVTALDRAVPYWAMRMVEEGDLSLERLEEVLAEASASGATLDQVLVREGLALEEQVASHVAWDLGVPFVDPREYTVRLENSELVPEELARHDQLFPLFVLDGVITMGMADPADLAVIDRVRLRTNSQVDPCLVTPRALDALIEGAYGYGGGPSAAEHAEPAPSGALELENENANVQFVRSMIEQAAREGVSDIHIEPERDKLRIRNRLDGILHERSQHALSHHAPIVSRLKVLAKLDIAESRKPQDGHFTIKIAEGTIDVRVSTIPTICGENVVLRLLLSDGKNIALDDLGMPPRTLEHLKEFLEEPNGMILVTGPTGSGKTSTLYSALSRLATIERNVVTVEDPVEKRMPLLRQTEVNPKAGLTFATGLRSILRQDPDVIMVGEIRDRETAEIAVQAALTGHLVLSTLHTNTAAGAIVRLSEVGVAPFMITSSLRAVLSQRLVRRVCDACKRPITPDPRLVEGLGLGELGDLVLEAGAGCGRCLKTGYKGRVGIYEMLLLTPALSSALLGGAGRDAIEREANRGLIETMRADGVRKVRAGLTTLEEVARVTGLQPGYGGGEHP